MKIYNKIFLLFVTFFIVAFASFWLFNHVYSWLGVAVFLASIYLFVRVLINIINSLINN